MYTLYQNLLQNPKLFSQYVNYQDSLYVPKRYTFYCAMTALTNSDYAACLASNNDSGGTPINN